MTDQAPLTDLSFLDKGALWPPPSQKKRLQQYTRNRQLWKGEHDAVFGNWWRVLREDKAASLELVFNWHKRLSTLWANFLVGEPPRFIDGANEADDGSGKVRQEALDRISGKDTNAFRSTLHEITIDISRYGDALAKVSLEEEGAHIWAITPAYWFPIVAPHNLRKFTHHVLAWSFKRGDTDYLWAEIHDRGTIETRVYALAGNIIGERQPLAAFAPDVADIEYTRVNDFLVVPFSGLLASDEIFGADDYQDLDSVIQAIEVRAAQINRVLDKHTDPSMYGPPEHLETDADGQTSFRAGGRYFEVDEDAEPPGYVVWEPHMEYQFKELEWLIEQLYIISSTSPAAFGKLESGLAESGSALKRLMQAPLSKVAGLTMRVEPAAKQALKVAAELENAAGRGTPKLEHILIQWQDGLPADPKEQAQTEEIRIRSETSSHVAAIRRQDGGTQEEAETEYERIKEEANEKAQEALKNAEAIAATKKPAPGDETAGNTQADTVPSNGGEKRPPKKEK